MIVLAFALAALAGALVTSGPAARAAVPASPVADCNAHGTLTRHYTTAQLRNGLNTMPADIKEYTDCFDVIQRQLLAQLGKPQTSGDTSPNSNSSGSFLPTPVIIVLVVLVLLAATFGAVALRRRRGGVDGPND